MGENIMNDIYDIEPNLKVKADKALYEAKEGGRSRCCFAAVEDITDENGGVLDNCRINFKIK